MPPYSDRHNPIQAEGAVWGRSDSSSLRAGGTRPQTIAYLSSPNKKAFYLVGERTRELSFLEAVDIFRAEPDEKALAFGDAESRHYEQVRRAMKQYTLDQQRNSARRSPRLADVTTTLRKPPPSCARCALRCPTTRPAPSATA